MADQTIQMKVCLLIELNFLVIYIICYLCTYWIEHYDSTTNLASIQLNMSTNKRLFYVLDQFIIKTLASSGIPVNFNASNVNRTLIASPDAFLQMKNLTVTGGSALITICEILLFSPRKYNGPFRNCQSWSFITVRGQF